MKNGSALPPSRKQFFTVKEVADYIGVSLKTAYDYAKIPMTKGGPPVRRFGKNCIRFPREKFIEWANSPGEK
jgi:predicted DNA-binding transcriptional regulator AlpA